MWGKSLREMIDRAHTAACVLRRRSFRPLRPPSRWPMGSLFSSPNWAARLGNSLTSGMMYPSDLVNWLGHFSRCCFPPSGCRSCRLSTGLLPAAIALHAVYVAYVLSYPLYVRTTCVPSTLELESFCHHYSMAAIVFFREIILYWRTYK